MTHKEAMARRKRHPGLNASTESCDLSEVDDTSCEEEDASLFSVGRPSRGSSFRDTEGVAIVCCQR